MTKYVYSFDEGDKSMKDLLGGKGANLAEMTSLKIPVPPGFTITTESCDLYYKEGRKINQSILNQVWEKLIQLESRIGKKLGDSSDPLLVSVRSGAASSMPGMMDTILNLGLNDQSAVGLSHKTGNERFVWDSYRRFIQMFSNVVLELKHHNFEEVLERIKHEKNVHYDTELTADDLKKVVEEYKKLVRSHGKEFPQDPKEQLALAIEAVFKSWNNDRAILYRRLNSIHGLLGTAVNVQAMVFGNMGNTSGTGVCFSRNPSTGENKFYGEFLMNAQGEDVVAGIRTPQSIEQLAKVMPDSYKQLVEIRGVLEKHFKDMQDMEFTIQEGKLYILQTRNGKRTAHAAVRIAVEMEKEGLISRDQAILRVDANSLNQLLHKQLDQVQKARAKKLATGLPASPGAAVGEIVFDAEEAHLMNEAGKKVILVRTETSPEDLIGMNAAQGILTSRGGMTSHAAVVARGMGKCCVAGCADAKIDEHKGTLTIGNNVYKKGDHITLDGSEGAVFEGALPVVDPQLSGDFAVLMQWADEVRKLKVRTNADTPHDSEVARKFGAEGIGLCRTEHMFFEGDRIKAMREMIVAETLDQRKKALAKLLPYQKSDFLGIFEAMEGLPVTIRLLDPPLHEFLPKEEKDVNEIAREMNISPEKLKQRIAELHEMNPMMGHRGCRLGITYPEITEMQTEAIILAAIELKKKGKSVLPEIMIPLVGHLNELKNQAKIVRETAEKVMKQANVNVDYKLGTMIEVPRGALTADELAETAEFFSFGTNDLTQMTFGFSRDDAGKFIKDYQEKNILTFDPFQTVDQTGVGALMQIAAEKGRRVRPDIKLGICGEHGGDPQTVEFCHRIGLNYVSCSPFRVPIARLAAAQAVLRKK